MRFLTHEMMSPFILMEELNGRPVVWVQNWFEITKKELLVLNEINKRMDKFNDKIFESNEYKNEQERKEYERLKAKFEGK